MPYLHEDALRKKAGEYILMLKKAGIKGEIVMIRDYLAKLSIKQEDKCFGNLIMDYKARKDTFSIRTQELHDKSIEDVLLTLWDRGELSDETIKIRQPEEDSYEIYVDGSYINNCVGYGVVILKNGEILKEFSGPVTDPVFTGSRQVGGEITAVMEALAWCKKERIDRVSVFYDLENLKKWATGEFSANIPMSKAYRDFVQNSGTNVQWNKVLAHSGVKWNERADELAKKGAGDCTTECITTDLESCSYKSVSDNSVNGSREKAQYGKENFDSDSIDDSKNGCSRKSSSECINEEIPDIIKELEKTAERFALYLEDNGYVAEFLRIYNKMAAKICVEKDGDTLGYIDIYNTRKLYLQPKYHEIKQADVRKEMERLWEAFTQK